MNDFVTSAALLIGFVFLVYVVLVKPQLNKLRQQEKFLAQLRIGIEVVTSGGVIGKIIDLQGENVAIIESTDGTKLRIMKRNIDCHFS